VTDQTDQQLLRDYAEHRTEAAFVELIRRHVDIVYSAALRRVGDSHLAQDVTQAAFVSLAQNARQLAAHPVLSGWLHRTTQNITANLIRANTRRHAREQEAVTMNLLLSASSNDANWQDIAPHLDAALDELDIADRDAVMLRYFEKKSASEMATQLGISDDAAQKRVSRAVERLREFFAKRGVTVGAGGLVVVITANAVQAAPVGLAVTISTAAVLAGTTLATTTTTTTIKAIAMTTIQKTIITATIAVLAGAGIYEARQAAQLQSQVKSLQQQQAPLAEQIQQLQNERDDATNGLASLLADNERLNQNTAELLRLRGEVGRLRQQLSELKTSNQSGAQALQLAQIEDLAEQTKEIGRNKSFDGRNYATQFIMFADENKGWYPTNWQQLVKYEKDFAVSGTNEFEMLLQRPIHQNDLGTNVSRTALIREYRAWPAPDGRWGKVYGFADGRSQVVLLKDGNFTAWEEQNTYIPEAAAK
jgi:RNA polymerase sigma factor (sigma-70 family)